MPAIRWTSSTQAPSRLTVVAAARTPRLNSAGSANGSGSRTASMPVIAPSTLCPVSAERTPSDTAWIAAMRTRTVCRRRHTGSGSSRPSGSNATIREGREASTPLLSTPPESSLTVSPHVPRRGEKGSAAARRGGTTDVPGPRRLRFVTAGSGAGTPADRRNADRRGPMTGEPGVDHPEEQSEAEVTLTGRGVSVSTRVEFVGDAVLSVRPSVSDYAEQVVAAVGDRVEVFWKAGEETRALPAEVLQVEGGAAPRWRLQITGPAEVSQRRQAVRGRLTLPVAIGYGSVEMTGETVDLSENGL